MFTLFNYRRCILLLIILLWIGSANAEIPQTIYYQGRLTYSSGKSVPDGRYRVQFRIWTTSEGPGFTLWDSGLRDIDVSDGLFGYQLGSAVPLPPHLFSADTSRWLGIQIEGDPEMTPRIKMASTAFAYHSLTSDTAEYSRATPIPVIRETNKAGGTTEMIGPDAGTIVVSFDSTFTAVPLVFATVVLRVDCGELDRGSVPYWDISVTETDFELTIYECDGCSTLNGCAVDIAYMALQIGP